MVPLLKVREESTSPQRQDFERLLEKCGEAPGEPLGTHLEEHKGWKSKQPEKDELSGALQSAALGAIAREIQTAQPRTPLLLMVTISDSFLKMQTA